MEDGANGRRGHAVWLVVMVPRHEYDHAIHPNLKMAAESATERDERNVCAPEHHAQVGYSLQLIVIMVMFIDLTYMIIRCSFAIRNVNCTSTS